MQRSDAPTRRTSLCLVPLLTLLLPAVLLPASGGALTLHVAPGAGSDGDGSRQAPFAALEQAQQAVRTRIAAGLSEGVTVELRGGAWHLPRGLAFDARDSGTGTHSVTWRSAPGEVARLIGGIEVTGLRRDADGRLAGRLPGELTTHQLFEDGQRLDLAREPDAGYLRMEGPVEGFPKTAFVHRPGDLDLDGLDWTAGRVLLWPGHDWFTQDKPLVGVDPAARSLRMEGDEGYDMRPGNRYFLYNVRAFLDRPGEAWIAADGRSLTLWPRRNGRIEASTAPHVIAVRGTAADPVRNLHFADLDLALAEDDAVLLEGVADVSLTGCRVENARRHGISVEGAARRVRIAGNEIRRNGQHGVSLQGPAPPGADINGGHRVVNNHIHHGGRLVGHGYGVRISQSGDNEILHNHIHHMPRYGVSLKGLRYQVLKEQVQGVTFANRHDYLHSRRNRIAFNHIHDVNLDSQDTGALESWGPGRDNVYDHNLIHDTGNDVFNLQSGIYLDDASDHFTVTRNVIYGVIGTGGDQCIFAKGIGHRIENNVLVVGPTNVSAIRSLTMAGERTDGHRYQRNLVLFEPPPAPPDTGAFGQRLRDLHDAGTTLRWTVHVPAAGDYAVWLRYTTSVDMSDRTELSVDGGAVLSLPDLSPTGGWNHWQWRRVGALSLAAGSQRLLWENRAGGGIDLDALVLSDEPGWRPQGTEWAPPSPGSHRLVVQVETSVADRRVLYHFSNWSDGRVSRADSNLIWNGNRRILVAGGPGSGPLDHWQRLGHDTHSVVADPLFVDAVARSVRLRDASPAHALGFEAIDLSRVGLRKDYPERLR